MKVILTCLMFLTFSANGKTLLYHNIVNEPIAVFNIHHECLMFINYANDNTIRSCRL